MVGVYHLPTKYHANDSNAVFIMAFLNFMCDLQLQSKNILILDNFNLHVNDKSDTNAQQFIDMVEASRLKQWIKFPTHKHGNTLDLIITELATGVQIKNVHCGPYISDHCIITCTFNIPKTKMNIKQIKYRNFKKADIVEMISDMDLDSINLDSQSLNHVYQYLWITCTRKVIKNSF